MLHLIINPVAGRGRSLRRLRRVKAALEPLPYRVHPTRAPGHAAQIAASLPQDATILVLGGDGTLHEVASACVHTGRTLGVVPGGSGDDFAVALRVERHSLQSALTHALSHNVVHVDTATVNGAPFINSLGTGFDAEVAHAFGRAPKILRERAAYLYAVALTLPTLRRKHVEVTVDGAPFYHGPALLTSIQNGPRTGGSFVFAPAASLTDGLLNVVVAGRIGVKDALYLLPKVLRGERLNHPEVHETLGKRITICWEEATRAHMEGQFLEAQKRFEVEVAPRSLRVLYKGPR